MVPDLPPHVAGNHLKWLSLFLSVLNDLDAFLVVGVSSEVSEPSLSKKVKPATCVDGHESAITA
jgi:hypothetical protein